MGRFKIFQRKKEKDGCAVETGSQPAGLHAQISTTSQGAHPPVAELEKRVEKLGDRVYCAVGYALSNVTMVAVEGGKVIVDTTESLEAAREIKAEFDRLVPGPVKGIFYTHSHPDHILGTPVFYEPGVDIWAQVYFTEEIRNQLGMLSSTFRKRASKQFGDRLPAEKRSGGGIGPSLRLDEDQVPPLMYPTKTFFDQIELSIGGVTFKVVAAPGETRDHLFVYLPDEKTVISGDNVYRAFPNLYAIRGVSPRPVGKWIQSLDKIRWLEPEYLSTGHTEPLRGRESIQEVLTTYRDAIAYLHAEVIRLTNQGCVPDEMATMIQLPEHLRDHPYLRETYGKIPWAVRGIHEGYLGWFDGNATNLQPLSKSEFSSRIVTLAGGSDHVVAAIKDALSNDDPQWCTQLCDVLLAHGERIEDAKRWKAEALEQLGEREPNPVGRNYYFASAEELRGATQAPRRPAISRDTLKYIPIESLMQSLPARLRLDRTENMSLRIGFEFTDSGAQFTFYIRRGIGEIRPGILDAPDFVVTSTEDAFKDMASGAVSGARAALTGSIKCSGGVAKLRMLKTILHPP